MAKKDLIKIGQLLQGTFKELKCEENFQVYPIWSQWKELVGDTIAEKSEPAFVKNGTLVVSVQHPVWLTELNLQKETILKKIKESGHIIQTIRFRLK